MLFSLLCIGYQRELNYRHVDGSYSAFMGDKSSIWLTAFVLKSFAQAANLIHIDEMQLTRTAMWITLNQLENGCFPVIGKVFHKKMKVYRNSHTNSRRLQRFDKFDRILFLGRAQRLRRFTGTNGVHTNFFNRIPSGFVTFID